MREDRQRLDKWLWFARFAKTRTLAAKLVTSGYRARQRAARRQSRQGPGGRRRDHRRAVAHDRGGADPTISGSGATRARGARRSSGISRRGEGALVSDDGTG